MSAARLSRFLLNASAAQRLSHVLSPSQMVTRRCLATTNGFLRTSRPQLGVITFKLADIGEGIAEVELLKWYTKVGDVVEEMDNLCEVQSDKSAVEISSPHSGKIIKFHHQIGEMVKIGTPLMDIDVEGDIAAAPSAPTPVTAKPEEAKTTAPKPETSSNSSEVKTSPACRVLAKDMGIDLSQVKGTGAGGRIIKEDILNFKSSAAPAATPEPKASTPTKPKTATEEKEEVMLTSGVAKGMIKSMKASLEVPHMSLQEDIDMSNLMSMRGDMNQYLASMTPPSKLTVTPLIVKAVSQALKQVPIMNSKFNTTSQDRYTLYHNHNISIAIDTPSGLLVPNIKNVESLTLVEIQEQLGVLQGLSSKGKLTPANLTGGTISISNVGAIGGTAVRPILFDGQAAILGLGKLQKLPRYNPTTKTFEARDIMNVTASVDHRHVDGATVARFITTLKKILENPSLLMV